MNETLPDRSITRALLLRVAIIVAIATLLFAFNLGVALSSGPGHVPPPLLRLFLVGSVPAISWVALSIPVQLVTRRLVRRRLSVALLAHVILAAGFQLTHSALLIGMRAAMHLSNPQLPPWEELWLHAFRTFPENLLVYVAIVAGTLAWDNWRLSVRRERTAAHLAAQLTRAELSALRSKMHPHFLFNALHGISSVMETDVAKARQMMVALSNLLRSSLHAGNDRATVEQEVQFTRDYLDLQHMRFEDRLGYDVQVAARPDIRVPAFLLQPLVENAVIHGMADRSEPTHVTVAVREVERWVEIEVRDNGPGFPQSILDGTRPLGVGLSTLRARLPEMPGGGGTMTLQNMAGGGAQVIVRVPIQDEGGSDG